MTFESKYLESAWIGRYEAATKLPHLIKAHLSLREYDAIVAPKCREGEGGVFAEGKCVEWSRFWAGDCNGYAPDQAEDGGETAFYLGMLYGCWGHCLSDDLRHVWPIAKGIVSKDIPIVYTTLIKGERLPENFFLLLEAAGVNRQRLVCVEKPTRFRKLLFADPSYWQSKELGYRVFTQEYVDTIETIRERFVVGNEMPHRRIYLSRTGWVGNKPDVGEEFIEAAFRAHFGCEVFRPEMLTLAEMIKLMAETKTLVSTGGSCQMNSLFLAPGSESIVIRKSGWIDHCQVGIDQIRDLNVTVIDANGSWLLDRPKEPWRGPFFLYVNSRLARFLGIKSHFPVRSFLVYVFWFLKMRTRRCLSFVKHRIFIRMRKMFLQFTFGGR